MVYYEPAVWNLASIAEMLYEYGIIVFLLVFTIIFAVLQKTNILGTGKKNLNIIIALVMGLMVIVPHISGTYPYGADVVDIINSALPQVSLLAIAGIMLLMLIGLFGGESRWMGGALSGWIAILSFIFIVIIFTSAAGFWENFYIEDYIGSDTLTMVLIVLVFGVIVWYITREPTPAEGAGRLLRFGEEVGKFFGGKK